MTRDDVEATVRHSLTSVYSWAATGTLDEATKSMNAAVTRILKAVDGYVVAECQRIDERRAAL